MDQYLSCHGPHPPSVFQHQLHITAKGEGPSRHEHHESSDEGIVPSLLQLDALTARQFHPPEIQISPYPPTTGDGKVHHMQGWEVDSI